MIFDIELFKERIVKENKYTKDSIRTYSSCLSNMNKKIIINDLEKIKVSKSIERFILDLKTTSNKQKYISAIRRYEDICLQGETIFDENHSEKVINKMNFSSKKKGKLPGVSYQTAFRKINALKNKKLKISLRIQLKTGLRVFEISNLRKKNIDIQENTIKIFVIEGKGKKDRYVETQDGYLSTELKEFLKDKNEKDKLFYSRDYLRKQAKKHDICSHDLRRLYASKRMESLVEEGRSKLEAMKKLKLELGHDSLKDTRLYIELYNKSKLNKTKI